MYAMFKKAVVVLALIVATGTAAAGPPQEKGFYVVGAAGESIYDSDWFGNFGDDDDNSFHIAVGYKILRYLAIEARYADFGTFEVFLDEFDVSATSIHVVGIAPFGQSGWEFFGQLGLGSVDVDYDFDNFLDGSESAMAGGIGFRWYPTPKVALGIQTDVYVWDYNNGWGSSVGATQLSLEFIF